MAGINEAEAQAPLGYGWHRRLIAAAALAVLAGATLYWGYFIGTHTDVSPVTSPITGKPSVLATDGGCPIKPGQVANSIAVSDTLLVAPRGYVHTTHNADGGTDTAWYFPPLQPDGKVRATHRWFRSTEYAYVTPAGTVTTLHPVQLGAHSCPLS
jgi:hypothetical protein